MRPRQTKPIGAGSYALRKILIEPVFGQLKTAMGFRRSRFAACKGGDGVGHRLHVPRPAEALDLGAPHRLRLRVARERPPLPFAFVMERGRRGR
jgi:hypothetical protein